MYVCREGHQVGVAEASAHLGRRRGGGHRAVDITARLLAEHVGDQQVPALDAIVPVLLDEASRPCQPTTAATHLSGQEQPHPDPEGAGSGAEARAGLDVAVMCAFERREMVLFAPDHELCGREQLEVLRARGRCASAAVSASAAPAHACAACASRPL